MKGTSSNLQTARRHVAKGEQVVAHQERLVESLRQRGQDAAVAQNLLATFQVSLTLLRDDLRRLEWMDG